MLPTVDDILHRGNLVTIQEDATVAELNRLLSEHQISGVPVLDERGNLSGVVTKTDIIKLISKDLEHGLGFYTLPLVEYQQRIEIGRDLCQKHVADIMERRVHSVTPKHSVVLAARIMRNLHIHRLLVLEDQHPVGILTALDLLKVLADPKLTETFYSASIER